MYENRKFTLVKKKIELENGNLKRAVLHSSNLLQPARGTTAVVALGEGHPTSGVTHRLSRHTKAPLD